MRDAASKVRVTGPFAAHAESLRRCLLSEGYTPRSTADVLRLAAQLSRWLHLRRAPLAALTPTLAERFVRHRRRAGYTRQLSTSSLRPIVAFLASAGAIDWQKPVDRSPAGRLLRCYVEFLYQERGLTAATVRGYAGAAKRFLVLHPDVRRLTAAEVTGFILRVSRRSPVATTKLSVLVLRSLLRYLHVVGEIDADLTGALPPVAGWRLVSLPKGISGEDVAKLLRGCDRRTAVGRRDYAVILLLVRLGLRAGETAALTLDDVRWAEGEVTIRGKGSESRLPLPKDVGRALVAYLRVRGRAPRRNLFLRMRAPHRGLHAATVTAIVRTACSRAGLAPIGAHRLRHTAATAMLRKGASLTEIAQVLRHRSVDTTAIYAKVDTERLRAIARPWPGDAP